MTASNAGSDSGEGLPPSAMFPANTTLTARMRPKVVIGLWALFLPFRIGSSTIAFFLNCFSALSACAFAAEACTRVCFTRSLHCDRLLTCAAWSEYSSWATTTASFELQYSLSGIVLVEILPSLAVLAISPSDVIRGTSTFRKDRPRFFPLCVCLDLYMVSFASNCRLEGLDLLLNPSLFLSCVWIRSDENGNKAALSVVKCLGFCLAPYTASYASAITCDAADVGPNEPRLDPSGDSRSSL